MQGGGGMQGGAGTTHENTHENAGNTQNKHKTTQGERGVHDAPAAEGAPQPPL